MTLHHKPATIAVQMTVNTDQHSLTIAPSIRLSEVLRNHLGLTGTKIGCDAGDCGACTIGIDGHQACACLIPAAQADGRMITTVEGLAQTQLGQRLQASFARHGAAH